MQKTWYILFCSILFCNIVAALTSCSKDDDPTPFDRTLLDGHWYAEIPLTGETQNWRTEEEGDMATYDHVGAMIYLHSEFTNASYWGFFYLKDGDLVNFGGIHSWEEDANFDYTVTPDGRITPDRYLEDMPKVEDMRYIDGKIYAKVNNRQYVFTRPTEEQNKQLSEYWEMLLEAGMGGFSDGEGIMETDLKDKNAVEVSRVKRR